MGEIPTKLGGIKTRVKPSFTLTNDRFGGRWKVDIKNRMKFGNGIPLPPLVVAG